MFQLDLEEFLIANGVGQVALDNMRSCYEKGESLSEAFHSQIMKLFLRYLIVGGMPDAVNEYLHTHNVVKVREVQESIRMMYGEDASKYEHDNGRNLLIRRIFDLIPSQMENKKKRIVAKDIQGKEGDRFSRYTEEFEYLISSGITVDVHAISNPKYPLKESVHKNLIKLYCNDVGLLTSQLYRTNLTPILNNDKSINLGSVYENIVATELKAHGNSLFYYDNRQRGEVDFIIDDYNSLSVLPIEVKSGKDYSVHSALSRMLATPDYYIKRGIVLSNAREVKHSGGVTYFPIYYVMFIGSEPSDNQIFF